jgi:hypothetical protein
MKESLSAIMFQRGGEQRKKIAASTIHDYNDERSQLTGRFSNSIHYQIGEATTA